MGGPRPHRAAAIGDLRDGHDGRVVGAGHLGGDTVRQKRAAFFDQGPQQIVVRRVTPGTERGAGVACERRKPDAAARTCAGSHTAANSGGDASRRRFCDTGFGFVRNDGAREQPGQRFDPVVKRGVHAVDDGRPRFDIDTDMLKVGVIEQVSDQDRRVSRIGGARPERASEPTGRQVYRSAGARRPKAERALDPVQGVADTPLADVRVRERCEGGRRDGKDRTPVDGNGTGSARREIALRRVSSAERQARGG